MKGLKLLKLQTADIDSLKEFYGGVLGLVVEDRDDGIAVSVGGSSLCFGRAPDGSKPRYHFAFDVPENRIEDAQVWLSERSGGMTANSSPLVHFETWNAHATYFKDPAGNVVELIARHDMANSSLEPFGPTDLLYVSELGMVVPNVLQTAAQLEDVLGLKPYGQAGADFTAVGRPDGLLILVREGRIWFGSDGVEAEPFPAYVEIGSGLGAELKVGCYHVVD